MLKKFSLIAHAKLTCPCWVFFVPLQQLMMAFWTASLTALLLHPSHHSPSLLSLILLSPVSAAHLLFYYACSQLQLGAHFSFNQRGFYCKIRFVSFRNRCAACCPPLCTPLFPLQRSCFCSVRLLPPLINLW